MARSDRSVCWSDRLGRQLTDLSDWLDTRWTGWERNFADRGGRVARAQPMAVLRVAFLFFLSTRAGAVLGHQGVAMVAVYVGFGLAGAELSFGAVVEPLTLSEGCVLCLCPRRVPPAAGCPIWRLPGMTKAARLGPSARQNWWL